MCGRLHAWTPAEAVLTVPHRPDPLVFRLAAEPAWTPEARWTLVCLRGRYAGRDAQGRHVFWDGVPSLRAPDARDHAAVRATAEELARAFAPENHDPDRVAAYAGRVVEVEGIVDRVVDADVYLRGRGVEPVRCRLADPADAAAFQPGAPARLRGFCAGHELLTVGVTLELCVRP